MQLIAYLQARTSRTEGSFLKNTLSSLEISIKQNTEKRITLREKELPES
jgi:sensor histidine kinase YesM